MPAGAGGAHSIVRRSQLSEADYREIWQYIAADNPDAADQLLRPRQCEPA
jgi:plasmid stabilization system protein ParE